MYGIVRTVKDTLENITKISYENLYDGIPEFDSWRVIQKLNKYPSDLIRFQRKPLLCKDGFFREPSRAVQEYLIDVGFISTKSDCCSNIPWKFFVNYGPKEKPYDKRVQRILDHLKTRGISRVQATRVLKKWKGRGAPDIIDFGPELQCVEVKFLGDNLHKDQKSFHQILRGLDIPVWIFEFQETERTKTSYQELRKHIRAEARKIYSDFWTTAIGKKLLNFIKFHLEKDNNSKFRCHLTPWKITSRRTGGEEIETFMTRPSSLVKTLCVCIRYQRKNCPIEFSESDIVVICEILFQAGTLKWWIASIVLCPWIKNGKKDTAYMELLSIAYAWEEQQRTQFWQGTPPPEHFRKESGFRSKPEKIKFSENDLFNLYEYSKKTKKADASEDIVNRFEFLTLLQANLEISSRDCSYGHYARLPNF